MELSEILFSFYKDSAKNNMYCSFYMFKIILIGFYGQLQTFTCRCLYDYKDEFVVQ